MQWVYAMSSEDGRWALLVAEKGTESELWSISLGEGRRPDLEASPVRLLADSAAFHTPVDFAGAIHRADVSTLASVPFLPPRVPFDASAYETGQVFATSKDGTRVLMFVTAAS